MLLKVCGMRDEGNIRQVAMLRPDLMGFIFYPGSPRYVGEDFPVAVMSCLGDIAKVGVFVNQATSEILEKVKKYSLDYVQLHGDEPIEQVRELSAKVKVIKVISGNNLPEPDLLSLFEPFIAYWLTDSRTAVQRGGTGRTFDWNSLKGLNLEKGIILSGGIGPEEAAAVRNLKYDIAGIDVNSKAEDKPAVKNVDTLKLIYNALHG